MQLEIDSLLPCWEVAVVEPTKNGEVADVWHGVAKRGCGKATCGENADLDEVGRRLAIMYSTGPHFEMCVSAALTSAQ